jgi:hypothetical protein
MARQIIINGYSKTATQWAATTGIPRTTLLSRLQRGVPKGKLLKKAQYRSGRGAKAALLQNLQKARAKALRELGEQVDDARWDSPNKAEIKAVQQDLDGLIAAATLAATRKFCCNDDQPVKWDTVILGHMGQRLNP